VTVLAEPVLPTTTELNVRLLEESVTGALPLPVRLAVCGLLPASSVKVRVPLTEPIAVGEKVMPTVQLAPPAILVPQVLVAIANPSLTAMLVKLSVAVSRFVKVTVRAVLVPPATTELKLRLVGESVTGALPDPVRLTVCGLVMASSVNVSVPVTEPVPVGENVTPTVQLAPAATLVTQVLLATVNPALAATVATFRLTFARLVNVTVFAALVNPTATEPKFKLLEEKETGALPDPARFTVCVPASSVTVRVPEAEPRTLGVKETWTAQLEPGAMLAVQLLV